MRNLKKLFTQYWEYLAIKTAVKVGIFDMIANGINNIKKISQNGNFNEKVLSDLLIALENSKLIKKEGDRYNLTENGYLLTENHPKTLKYACILWGEEHMTAWQNLEYTLKTGKPAFEKIFKQPFFDCLKEKEEHLDIYHKAMYEYARDDYKNICNKIDFKDSKIIMDVGGGYGALINSITKQCPQIKAILFDKPEVISNVKANNYTKIGGNFFEKIPRVADTIIMSRVIHDWDDDKANIILTNVYQALPENGILYLIENLTDKIQGRTSLLSLNMNIMTQSFERTGDEYKKITEYAGFKYIYAKKINKLQYVLKFLKSASGFSLATNYTDLHEFYLIKISKKFYA